MARKQRTITIEVDRTPPSPEDIEMFLERAGSFDPDSAIPLSEHIQELEKDPEMKRALDRARRKLKGAKIVFK